MIQSISIHSLLLKLKQGHEEALDVLYPRYARLFYAYARRRSLSHEDAEDIVQTTFWRMLDRISSYDEQSGGGERWLWSICRHLVIDALRQKSMEQLPEEEALVDESNPEHTVEKQESVLAFTQAWDALPEADRNELRRGRGRGPGRKAWHEAIGRLRTLYLRSES